MEKAGLLAGGAFTTCEPSAAGRIWKRGAAEWVSDELFNKKARRKRHTARDELVRLKGFEPPTYWFVASHSIQLSYSRISLAFYVSPSSATLV